MIDADVAAAIRAISTIADVAALEFTQKLCAFDEGYVFPFPQCERAYRRGGITPAILAVAVAHLQRFTAHLDLNRSAVTTAFVCLRHKQNLIRKAGTQEDLNLESRNQEYGKNYLLA